MTAKTKTKTKTKIPDYLPIQTCQYVEASYVFKDCPKAWDAFSNGDTWGDNNRTLVTPDVILLVLDQSDDSEHKEVKKVIKRLESLGQTYIDLEN